MFSPSFNKFLVKSKFPSLAADHKLLKNGLCCATAGSNQIRFLPPLIITKKHIDECIKIIIETCKEFED